MSRFKASLSVILPNYNHAAYLPSAVGALLSQERPPDEIVVVDDGSTDDSLQVLERLAARAPALRLIPKERNEGAVAALNRGLAAARGDFVYLAAADDWVLPGFFRRALERLDEDRHSGIYCAEAMLVDGNSEQPVGIRPAIRPLQRGGRVPAEEALKLLRHFDNWIVTSSTVFRREAMTEAGAFDPQLGSFADGFVARKIALARGLYFDPAVFSAWRILPGSLSRRRALESSLALEALTDLPRRIREDGAFPSWYPELFERRWRFTCSRLALESRPPNMALIRDMAPQSRIWRTVFESVLSRTATAPGRTVVRASLWACYRPTTVSGLLKLAETTLRRSLMPDDRRSRAKQAA